MASDYPIIFTERNGRFRTAFLDFPGCYGEGADHTDAINDARAEGVRCILWELEEGNPFPLRSFPEDLCRNSAGEVVMLTLTLPHEKDWSWLG